MIFFWLNVKYSKLVIEASPCAYHLKINWVELLSRTSEAWCGYPMCVHQERDNMLREQRPMPLKSLDDAQSLSLKMNNKNVRGWGLG